MRPRTTQGELRTVQQQLHKSESALESARSELRAGVRAVLGQGEDESQYASTLSGKEASTEVTLKRVLQASSMVQVSASPPSSDACCWRLPDVANLTD
jgi:DNA anti-recombination protein RmuC